MNKHGNHVRTVRVKIGELREIAIRAVHSDCRRLNVNINKLSGKDAFHMLDEIERQSPDTLAAMFYRVCSQYQYRMFVRDWNNQWKFDRHQS